MKPQHLEGPVSADAVNWWRFASTMSTAISFSAGFAHLMEMPAKMHFDPGLYVKLHRTLYPSFGRSAAVAEILSVVLTAGLAWWTRKREPETHSPTLAAASCLVASHAIFWALVSPVNSTMTKWPLDEIPSEWKRLRNQWEFSHAVRALLVMTGLGALLVSMLRSDHQ